MSNADDIAQIEMTLEEVQEKVEFREAILRLRNNSDFRLVVLDGFAGTELKRLVNTLNEVGFEDNQADINRMITSVSDFNRFLRVKVKEGNIAEQSIAAHEEMLDQIRAEG